MSKLTLLAATAAAALLLATHTTACPFANTFNTNPNSYRLWQHHGGELTVYDDKFDDKVGAGLDKKKKGRRRFIGI